VLGRDAKRDAAASIFSIGCVEHARPQEPRAPRWLDARRRYMTVRV